jgi:hypothetical protein
MIVKKSDYVVTNCLDVVFILFIASILTYYTLFDNIYNICIIVFAVIALYKNLIQETKFNVTFDYSYVYLIVSLGAIIFISNITKLSSIKIIDIIKQIYYFMPFILLVYIMSLQKVNAKTSLKKILYTCDFLNLIGIYEFIIKKSIFYTYINDENAKFWQVYAFGTEYYRVFNVFIHPIIYGNLLVCLFWINTYINRNKYIKLVSYILILINIYATKSRSSWISLFVTLILFIFRNIIDIVKNNKIERKKIFNLFNFLVLTIIFIFLFNDFVLSAYEGVLNRFSTVIGKDSNDVSKLQRIMTIKKIVHYMINSDLLSFLFGYGSNSVRNFMLNNHIVIPGFTTTDNQFISYFYNYGLLGLMVYIILLSKVTFDYLFGRRDKIFDVFAIVFISISVNSFFYEFHGWKTINLLYMSSLAYITVVYLEKDEQNLDISGKAKI